MLEFLIYILVFIIGSIVGLLFSYKKHSEPYIINGIDIVSLIISIVGWVLFINFYSNFYLVSIGIFLIALILGMRPGYGRKETFIGLLIAILIYIINNFIF
ncbi:energy-converting hydrogenase subunit EhaL family protein [Methanobrevibacter sp. DSM 116169]|uniref:energy-converting hydrogenase subunit EhaL family protein n=1 Tax=Methanobrevibacter sp. DSM 116169 TaxID=3242727 RepID=UPI0038FC50D5